MTLVVIVLACVLLAWAIISATVANALADAQPSVAIGFRPGYAPALESLSEHQVGSAVTSKEIADAERTALRSLRAAPLSAISLRSVAAAKQLKGDAAHAAALMSAAGRRNLRDPATHLWLFNQNLRTERYDEAFRHGDLLIRRRPDSLTAVYPTIVASLDRPGAMAALIDVFKQGPQWRVDFVRMLCEQGDAGDVALRIVQTLRNSTHPPSPVELQPVIGSLIYQGRYLEARSVWQALSPAARTQPLMYDGGFELTRGVPPLDWRFTQRDGLTAVERLEGGTGHGLYAEYATSNAPILAEQLLVLAPGAYRFGGRAKIDRMPQDAALTWSLICVPSEEALASVPLMAVSPWHAVGAAFQVPAQGCDAQWLRLKGSVSSTFDTASGWFDELTVAPSTSAQPVSRQAAG